MASDNKLSGKCDYRPKSEFARLLEHLAVRNKREPLDPKNTASPSLQAYAAV